MNENTTLASIKENFPEKWQVARSFFKTWQVRNWASPTFAGPLAWRPARSFVQKLLLRTRRERQLEDGSTRKKNRAARAPLAGERDSEILLL